MSYSDDGRCEFHWAEEGCDEPVEFRGAISYTASTRESVKFFCRTGVDDLAQMLLAGTIVGFWVEQWAETDAEAT